jgi:NADH:ubiquinone oxidoreductase subunit
MAAVYYHTSVEAFGAVAAARQIQIGRFPANVNVDFNARLNAQADDMQGYVNLKGYGEFDAANRPSGWNTWLTFSISPMAPTSTVTPTRRMVTK